MRPIKFRAYDKEAEHMVYSDKPEDSYTFGYEDGLLRAWYTEFVQTPDGGAEPRSEVLEPLMQFTGLVDKNGKEIYEGDVLLNSDINDEEGEHAKLCEVEWTDSFPGFSAITLPREGERYHETFHDWKILEVIGNIYENPELLKSTPQPEKE